MAQWSGLGQAAEGKDAFQGKFDCDWDPTLWMLLSKHELCTHTRCSHHNILWHYWLDNFTCTARILFFLSISAPAFCPQASPAQTKGCICFLLGPLQDVGLIPAFCSQMRIKSMLLRLICNGPTGFSTWKYIHLMYLEFLPTAAYLKSTRIFHSSPDPPSMKVTWKLSRSSGIEPG